MSGGGGKEPSETAEERELGRIAVERWNDYQIRFKPIEDEYIQAVQRTPSDYSEARGAAVATTHQAFGQAENKLQGNMFAAGLDPSSGQFIRAMDGVSQDKGLSMGTGVNEAEQAVDNAHVQGLQSVVQMGQGQAFEAMDGMGEIAGMATDDAIQRANRSFQNRQAGLQLVGTIAGAGASHYMNASTTPDLGAQNTGGLSEATFNAHNDGSGLYDPMVNMTRNVG
jgi:hypothetical protein